VPLSRPGCLRTHDMEEAGAAKVRHLLRPVLELFADRRVQSLTRSDIDHLTDWMLTSGRVRAGKPGTGLSPRTVKDTLAVLQRALDDAADERLITHNPCRRVKRPRQRKPEHKMWSDAEPFRFEAVASGTG
jgi:hypothetical protein